MEDNVMLLNCPVCCDKLFNSKESLIEHLSSILDCLKCPICQASVSSIGILIEHLQQNQCLAEHTDVIFGDKLHAHNNSASKEHTDLHFNQPDNENLTQYASNVVETTLSDDAVDNKMYVELFGKQLTKPLLQNQELKLVQENGQSRYMLMSHEDLKLKTKGQNLKLVTKQNSDGTISLTTVDGNEESTEPQQEVESQELYSCNTCGVSFNSVLEHIQNYHNDEEVVVEEPITQSMKENEDAPVYESIRENSNDKQVSRRVITETGDIVNCEMGGHFELVTVDVSDKKIENKQIKIEPKSKKIKIASPLKEGKKIYKNQYHSVVVKELPQSEGGGKAYTCTLCNVTVSSLDKFKARPCKTSATYACLQCTVVYDNAKSLCAHMKVHKGETSAVDNADRQFKCKICSTIFTTNKSLKLHKRMHDPIKSRPLEPPVETPDGVASIGAKFLCTICDKLIPLEYKTVHSNSHNTGQELICDLCNKKFLSVQYLEMHMNVHSTKKEINKPNNQDKYLPHSCSYCDRRFARPHEKVKHERIHTGEKPHSCEICGKSFRVSYCLTLHMRTHTGARPYACPHCGKRFKAHSVYNHHLLMHSDVRAYKCPFCPKAFKTSVQLAGHKNSHTKPFLCQTCNRPFASLYAVRVHTETHKRLNNLKFSCSLCGASYARTFALRDHIKQAHKNELVNSNDDGTVDIKEDGWIVEISNETVDRLDKNLGKEITEMEMPPAEELIIP